MAQAGDRIGPYTLARLLGRGGFGEVWLGQREGALVTTQVAVKLPYADTGSLESLHEEARLWVKVGGHPNVLPIIEADVYGDQVAVVSEYVADGSLSDWLARRGSEPVPLGEAADLVLGILVGLEHLHARKIVHRDLKPANILMQEGIPRLTDFGLSRLLSDLTWTQTSSGTPAYMAPEAFAGDRSVPTDLWSVGIIFYQLLTGQLPFPQTALLSLMKAVTDPSPIALPEQVPPRLRNVLTHALEKDPASRFQTAAQMRASVRETLRETGRVAETISMPTPAAPRYLTVAVTGSMTANLQRTQARLQSLLRPYLSPYTSWYIGTNGTVDSTTLRHLVKEGQQLLLVGYCENDISREMKLLVSEHDLAIVDPHNEWIPQLTGAPSPRDIYLITKADLVILLWDGKSRGTAELLKWLRQVRKDHLVGFV